MFDDCITCNVNIFFLHKYLNVFFRLEKKTCLQADRVTSASSLDVRLSDKPTGLHTTTRRAQLC